MCPACVASAVWVVGGVVSTGGVGALAAKVLGTKKTTLPHDSVESRKDYVGNGERDDRDDPRKQKSCC